MSEMHLTPQQETEIARIKKQWLAEAEPYLNSLPNNKATLDGPDSKTLAQIQLKYKKRIQEVIEGI